MAYVSPSRQWGEPVCGAPLARMAWLSRTQSNSVVVCQDSRMISQDTFDKGTRGMVRLQPPGLD